MSDADTTNEEIPDVGDTVTFEYNDAFGVQRSTGTVQNIHPVGNITEIEVDVDGHQMYTEPADIVEINN